jgi:hypothetical protein
MLLSTSSSLDVLLGEDAYNTGGNFVVNNSLVVLANNVNSEFLEGC